MATFEDLEARVERLSVELGELREEHRKLKEAVDQIPGWFAKPEKRLDVLETAVKDIQGQAK